jgi:hypothetical protein
MHITTKCNGCASQTADFAVEGYVNEALIYDLCDRDKIFLRIDNSDKIRDYRASSRI